MELLTKSLKSIKEQYYKMVDYNNELRKLVEEKESKGKIIIIEDPECRTRSSTNSFLDHQSIVEAVFESKSVLPNKEAYKLWNNELEKIAIEIIQMWTNVVQYLTDNGCDCLNYFLNDSEELERSIFNEIVFSEVVVVNPIDVISSACVPFVRDQGIIRSSNHFQKHRTKPDLIDQFVDLSPENSPVLFEQHLQWDLTQKLAVEENLQIAKVPEDIKSVHSPSESPPSTNIYSLNSWKRKFPTMNLGKKKNRGKSSPIQLSSLRNSGELRNPDKSGTHLVVFIHGFQGSRLDMIQLKNYLQATNPENTEYLLINSLADQTHNSIEILGQLVADEIIEYIAKHFLKITRISFVSHSMGAVIARAAIRSPKMTPHLEKLYTFISLAGPHLGLWFSSSIISSGMKIWKKWANSDSLSELGMTDKESPEDCLLYKLSSSQEFSYFHNYLFFGSRQDKYSPFHSSVITIDSSMDTSNSKYNSYLNMALNIHDIIKSDQKNIMRINVCFSEQLMSQSGLSGKIGRTAHVTLLQSDTFLQIFASIYKQYL